MDSLSSRVFSVLPLNSHSPTIPVSSLKTENHPPAAARPLPQPLNLRVSTPSPPAVAAATILNAFESFINAFIDPPVRPAVDPRHVLYNNWSPVEELPPTPCQIIEGTLPPSLSGGVYIRNGPNPQFLPRGPYHLFDGDGMLHALRFSGGGATLCSRYVRTYKYEIERARGFPVVPNVFSGFNGIPASVARGAVTAARVLAGQFNPVNGIGLANTSLAVIGRRLYALGESGLPHEIKIDQNGDVLNLGQHDFAGKLPMSMTAHPKLDPETGETFAFRYAPVLPFLNFFRVNAAGEKQPDVPIFSMTSPSFLHDFAITKRYAIFNEIQIGINPFQMIGGGSPVGANPAKVPRIGIIPRYAADESEIRWVESSGFNSIHIINAWEEDSGDTVVVLAPNILSVEHTLERMDLIHASIEKLRIDLKTGMVSRQPTSTRNLDFGVVNPAFVGKKNKYVYAAVGDPWPNVSGVVKLDVSLSDGDRRDCIVASRIFGPGRFAGEPFFVSRQPENPDADEDDGYVVTYMHDENTGESRFLVMNARSPDLETVTAVRMPRRIPYGFHGLFVRETELNKL